MSIKHSDAIRNTLCNLVVDAIDGEAALSGTIQFMEGVYPTTPTALATLTMSNPAFGDAAAGANGVGQATANEIAPYTECVAGTVTQFDIRTGDATPLIIFSGTVTAVGDTGDIILSSTAIGLNDTISITSLTYTSSV